MKNHCYVKTQDDELVSQYVKGKSNIYSGWSPNIVVAKRQYYDEKHPDNTLDLNIENISEVAEKLIAFEEQQRKERYDAVYGKKGSELYQEFAKQFRKLKEKTRRNQKLRTESVDYITYLFSRGVDNIVNRNPKVTREMATNGYKQNGQTRFGEAYIFEQIFENIQVRINQLSAQENPPLLLISKLKDILNNWEGLVFYSRKNLALTEGLTLGNFLSYSKAIDAIGQLESEEEESEEAPKDHFDRRNEQISSFKTVSQRVRAVLRNLPVVKKDDDGNYMLDEQGNPIVERSIFGVPKMLNAVAAHNYLLDLLRHAKNKFDVYNLLLEASKESVWLRPLVQRLTIPSTFYSKDARTKMTPAEYARCVAADDLLGDLYVDFNKVFQKYSILETFRYKSGNKLRRGRRSVVLNNEVNLLQNAYMIRKAKYKPNSNKAVYDESGNIAKDNFEAFVENVKWFADRNFKLGSGEKLQASHKLYAICQQLDLNIPKEIFIKLINNNKIRNRLLKDLEYVYKNPTSYYNDYLKGSKDTVKYDVVYNYKPKDSRKDDRSSLQRFVDNVFKFELQYDLNSRVENKVKTKNEKGDTITMYSDILPGYMSQFIKDIQNLAEEGDMKGLKEWLDAKYKNNPFFWDETRGRFRNAWLNDLYNGNINDVWSFINRFEVVRGISDDNNNPFNNMAPNTHLSFIISDFFKFKREYSDAKIAYYPVFISGDANQHKVIAAPVYTMDKIMDYMVDLFYQERAFMDLADKARAKMIEDGLLPVSINTDKFYLLPEFNEIFKDFRGSDGKFIDITRDQVKAAIEKYFSIQGDAFREFAKNCVNRGLGSFNEENGAFEFSEDFQDIVDPRRNNSTLYNIWLNEKFAMTQQMSLMTISPAYYKNIEDLQKRYKETHSSGTKLDLYASINGQPVFDRNEDGSVDNIQKTIFFDEVKLNGEDTDPLFMEVIASTFGKDSDVYKAYSQKDGKNQISATDGQAYRTLESYRRVMAGTHKWTAEMEDFYQRLNSLKSKYSDSIPDKYIAELTKRSSVIFQPIKPFLFTHENYAVNDEGDIIQIPVQVKCSEALIIPELLPKDSRVRHLAEYMEKNHIDVAAATSCVKVGSFGSVSIHKANNQKELDNILSNAYVHRLNYRDYLIQTNVPPHNYNDRLFAVQIRKLILGGKYDDVLNYFEKYLNGQQPLLYRGNGDKYRPKQMTKYDLRHFYNELICANFIESLQTYLSKTADKEQLSQILIQNALSNDRESCDNVLGYALDNDGDFTMPLCEAIGEHDIVTNLIAIFKKMVNKQTILGGSGVQVSDFGIKDYNEDNNLRFVTNVQYEKDTDGNYKRDSNGNFIPIKGTATNVLYAEVEVPLVHTFTQPYTDENGKTKYREVAVDYNKYVNEDRTLKYDNNQYEEVIINGETKKLLKFDAKPLIDIDFPGLRDFIAYRIPTERDYSMINCKAVRFSRPVSGGIIKVPAQCVVISGFDFDIDKLYFMFKAFVQDNTGKFIEYNPNKSTFENPKFARDNMILEIIRQRLMDPNTKEERLTPGGFDELKKYANWMKALMYDKQAFMRISNPTIEDIESVVKDNEIPLEYNYTDLETLLKFNEQNQLADKLIGIFANQNTNHVYTMGISKLELNEPIKFGSFATDGLSNLLVPPAGVDPSLVLAQFLAASVDAVKDPVLNFLSLNSYTANTACLLARLGYNAFEIGLLLNQPVIKHVCEYAYARDMSLDSAIRHFYAELGIDSTDIEEGQPSTQELINNILYKDSSDATDEEQISILKLFERAFRTANELNRFVTKTKFTAANSIKPTFSNYYALNQDLDAFSKFTELSIAITDEQTLPIIPNRTVNFDNIPSYLGGLANNPFAFEQCMYDCLTTSMKQLMKEFPYDSEMYSKVREFFSFYSRTGNLTDKLIEQIHKELPVYILSNMSGGIMNGSSIYRDDLTMKEYFDEEFTDRLFDILTKYPYLQEYSLFKMLTIVEVNGKRVLKMGYATSLDNRMDVDEIKESWEAMLYDSNPEVSGLAKELFLYNFYRTGFGYGPASFIHYAPEALKENMIVFKKDNVEMTYKDFWKSLYENSRDKTTRITVEQLAHFLTLFIRNHIESSRFVNKIKGESKNDNNTQNSIENNLLSVANFKIGDEFAPEGVEIIVRADDERLDSNTLKEIARGSEKDGYVFVPCLAFYDKKHYQYVYFVLDASTMTGKPTNTAVYTRVDTLGQTNTSLNYNESTSLSRIYDTSSIVITDSDTLEEINETPINRPENKEKASLDTLYKLCAKLATLHETKRSNATDEEIETLKLNNEVLLRNDFDFSTEFFEFFKQLKNIIGEDLNSLERQLIDDILNEAQNKDLIVLDSEGNPMKSCK